MTPATVPTLLTPSVFRARLLAIRRDTTVIVAPVSNARLARRAPLNVTGTMTEAPFITTGIVIVFGPELPDGVDGTTLDKGSEGSGGRDLKNFSSLLDSSVSLCLIHPITSFLALTKYHLAPSPAKVSAKGKISSPGFRVATTAEDASGDTNSCVIATVGRDGWTVVDCECVQRAKSKKAVKIGAALSFVKV